jgi:hypothetical protein
MVLRNIENKHVTNNEVVGIPYGEAIDSGEA